MWDEFSMVDPQDPAIVRTQNDDAGVGLEPGNPTKVSAWLIKESQCLVLWNSPRWPPSSR